MEFARGARRIMVLAALAIPAVTLVYAVPPAGAATGITCVVTAVRRPPAVPSSQQDVTVTAAAGLVSIINGAVTNGTMFAPNFSGTNPTSVVVMATKWDETKPTVWSFDATDTAGHIQHCV
jgi:hypothetical protein